MSINVSIWISGWIAAGIVSKFLTSRSSAILDFIATQGRLETTSVSPNKS